MEKIKTFEELQTEFIQMQKTMKDREIEIEQAKKLLIEKDSEILKLKQENFKKFLEFPRSFEKTKDPEPELTEKEIIQKLLKL